MPFPSGLIHFGNLALWRRGVCFIHEPVKFCWAWLHLRPRPDNLNETATRKKCAGKRTGTGSLKAKFFRQTGVFCPTKNKILTEKSCKQGAEILNGPAKNCTCSLETGSLCGPKG